MNYKYDFHCHINEGSKDSKVNAEEYIDSLICQGFTGLLVTDHNTYDGYRFILKKLNYENFIVLKGIEYSTIDAGHILVIMPDEYDLKDLEYKSAKLLDLIKYVHSHNGILGPAHPCSEPYLSIFSSKKYKYNYDICKQFDFIEVFNAGEKKQENDKALELSNKYSLFATAGSDAHYLEHCGKAYVQLKERVTNNNELIDYIKKHKPASVSGQCYRNRDRERYDKSHNLAYLYDHIIISLSRKNCIIK